ncbi:SDR family oxidoreductase [Numidum massiliense]|uniref:SDR family oxidoreductase n=1 Tax=Numidum massiliense TaxID=1522315 RepID=UPI001E3F0AA9|nr:SDR family oxidoreductase [Numidum massiliense]
MFSGKVIVITGASSGIGAELAKSCAARGAKVVLVARSHQKLATARLALEVECKDRVPLAGCVDGASSLVIPTDVTQENDVQAMVARVIGTYGRIDVLVNNAGYGVFDRFAEAEIADMRGMMDVNYMGTVLCTKYVLPHMLAQGEGHVINIASVAGKIATAKSTGYAASKFAVIGFTDSLRLELTNTGVFVTAVCPGPVDTPFFERADRSGDYVRNVKKFMIKPQDVVRAVVNVIRRPRDEVVLPSFMRAAVRLQQLFPRLIKKVGKKWFTQK